MKLTLLVNYDLASNLALHYLLPSLSDHSVSVFYTKKTDASRKLAIKLQQLSEFEHEALKKMSELGQFFLSNNSRVLIEHMDNVNIGAGFERYQNSKPDLVISIRHMSILKAKTIALPNYGVINLHSGVLPKYRGVMATFWAMRNKEPTLGTSLHYINDATIDTGRVIAESKTVTRFDQSYLWNALNLYQAGCANVLNTIKLMNDGGLTRTVEQLGEARYHSFPSTDEINNFEQPLFNSTDSLDQFLVGRHT